MSTKPHLVPINLQDMDVGKVQQTVNDYISIAAKDCIKRKRIKKPREVVLKIKIYPEIDEETGVLEVASDWDVAYKVPGRKGSVSKAAVIDDMAMINPLDATMPMQMHLDQAPVTDNEDDEGPDGKVVRFDQKQAQ